MNKSELISHVALNNRLRKSDVKVVVDGALAVIVESLKKGEIVNIAGFGSFAISDRAARVARNPRTGETIQVPASKSPRFKASKAFKDALNKD